MDFNEYQEKTKRTATFPEKNAQQMYYLGLGIADEGGEVAGKLKKFVRDDGIANLGELNDEQKEALMKEVGDVLWYAAQLALACGYPFERVAEMNIEKTWSRFDRGKIHGSGDDR